MPGILVHLFVGIICAIVVFKFFKKKEYSFAILIGNLLPDFVAAGYASLAVKSIDPKIILYSAIWHSFEKELVVQLLWILLVATFVSFYLIFRIHGSKKRNNEYEDLLAFILLGFIIHMVMDMFVRGGILITYLI